MAQMTPEEMEHFQKMSDQWSSGLDGPLVGEKMTMDVLVSEYAQADPQYVVKTTGLAATHSTYRAVKGDGQCGWRATVFSYFEILLMAGDPSLVQFEKLRFESFADSMRMIGMDYDLLSDMFEETFTLFDKIQTAVNSGVTDMQIVNDALNGSSSDSIVYHFKMITATYMRLHADQYEPFMEMSVDEYCVSRIDPTNQEIDQIGLQALTDAVISAAGINLEVLYLDRSMGDEVTPHPFSSVSNTSYIIRLLYRPGHYDIIYKDNQPMRVMLAPQSIPQRMENSHTTQTNPILQSLYGQSGEYSMMPSMPSSSDYDNHGWNQHTQHGYEHYQQYPSQQQTYYTPSPYTSIPHSMPPPPTTFPVAVLPQAPPPSRQSNSSRSATMSPSPISTAPIPTEPQIRFTSSMYNMHKHEGVPLTQSPYVHRLELYRS